MKNIVKTFLFSFFITVPLVSAPLATRDSHGYVGSLYHNLKYGTGLVSPYCEDNFREVVPGQLYRSNTLPPELLKKYVEDYGIKTILNVRGHSQQQWWENERDAVRETDARLIDCKLSTHRYPTPAQLATMLEVMHGLQGPVLIHCRFGRDRTGIACALWLVEKQHASAAVANKQQSWWRFGHRGLPFVQTQKKFITLWRELRETHDSWKEAHKKYAEIYEQENLALKDRKYLKTQAIARLQERGWHTLPLQLLIKLYCSLAT